MDGTHALTEALAAARRRLAAAQRDELRPLADRLLAGPAAEADAPPDARDCLGQVGKATTNLGRLIDELIPPAADGPDAEAFLVQVRHNLKTPIHQIVGYAELLLDEEGPWKERHAAELERLRAQGQRLRAVIDALLHPPRDAEPAPVGGEPHGAVAPAAPDQRGRILVVDDQASNRDLLARWLRRLGHEYATAENGGQALDVLGRQEFDLVLLDYLMPELDGKEVLKRLKADVKLRHIPVIMISALNELDNVVDCIEMGAEDYLPKPFQPVLLKARLGACLEKKRLRDREVDHLRQIDDLLNAILPPQIVRELTATGQVQPRRHDRVAVLFADIVGFTGYCEKRKPEEVVEHLRGLVETFEEAAVKHGVQKIKTIGDSFMAAAGLLEELENPVLPCVRCAREMIALAKDLPPHWDLRVGVHVGSVVAGLLGSRQYLYDLWGATVNTAARVEALGVPGSVCLSKAAWEYVAAAADGESRGFVEAKGIGKMEVMRFVRFRGEK